MTQPWTISRVAALTPDDIDQLAFLLIDCVEGGASIGFMDPIPPARAREFWTALAPDVEAGHRILLVATDTEGICGTVQLVCNLPDNQPHRADLCKLMVHRRARRQGLGAALTRAAESAAQDHARTLLVLDAVTDGPAARLYEQLGWIRVGDVPDFALYPDGRRCSTTYFYRDLSPQPHNSP